MQRHFDEELGQLKDKLFKMGLLAEEAIRRSVESLIKRNSKLAEEVIEGDQKINILEIEIDEFGHELIALRQPTAVDLRFITMVLKINSDLERAGDQAVNIAESAIAISREAPLKSYLDIPKMADLAIAMVKESLDSFVERDAAAAKAICERDDELDDLKDRVYGELQEAMKNRTIEIPQAVSLIMVAHNLERIGDLATNIAEDVIYVAKGIDIRHHITERRGD
ncbi:MAG: phosphate transport system regulatory protein PhoU [Omnitrophica bacterium RIFCSPHIGHO2_02_FULL_46_11]|nr:MAG: phosphate transport system regulatory protein PhoU [Omnitrophica bacterium RIFCSPHIGHO2_02_FULL_46_11]OGW87737.1 MAG: phosphate transport system regulatory protein PhoU [Omnitrophica bacterium RIFCSPLOWO2_01_FULL_45_10b]